MYNEWQHDQIHFLYTLCTLLDNQQNIAIMFFSYVIHTYIYIHTYILFKIKLNKLLFIRKLTFVMKKNQSHQQD